MRTLILTAIMGSMTRHQEDKRQRSTLEDGEPASRREAA
jgi:hypothetical protein